MGWKASTLGLLGTAKGSVGVGKRSSKLVLALSLLVLAALAIFALVSGVKTTPSVATEAGAETGSARWTALGEAYSENVSSSVTTASTLHGKDAGFMLDEVNPRWSVVAEYFGGESVTRGVHVHDARQSARDERVRTCIEQEPKGLESARFGP